MLLPAQALVRAGARVRLFYGARTRGLLVEADRFAEEGCEVICATDDGSYGHHGFVTETLAAAKNRPARILACPVPHAARHGVRCMRDGGAGSSLSLEETFECGVGGCWGCVVPLDRNSAQAPGFPGADAGGSDAVYARICKEGPVFWAHGAAMVSAETIDLSYGSVRWNCHIPTLMGSGCYGSGEEFAPFVDLAKIGGVVLKSVTRAPRLGNPTPRLVQTPAGMLNAIRVAEPRYRVLLAA